MFLQSREGHYPNIFHDLVYGDVWIGMIEGGWPQKEEWMPRAKVGEIQIHYEEYGQGQPLIMILGLGQDTATWALQIPEFSKHFRVIVLDNRDSGKSSNCSEIYTTEGMARDILGLMDCLTIDRTHLLGTSMGGMVAQQLALMAPERIISLVLASTTSWGEG